MSLGAQNMETTPDALDTAENESGSAKHEIETGLPRYRPKRVRERKHENGTRCPRYRLKGVRERKT
jgi:hypothetical protein